MTKKIHGLSPEVRREVCMLSLQDLAKVLHRSYGYLRRRVMEGPLPGRMPLPQYTKIGNRILFRLEDVQEYINEHIVHQHVVGE